MKKKAMQIFTMLFWILFLIDADSYYAPYLVTTILAFVCFYHNCEIPSEKEKKHVFIKVSASIFSFMVILAEYQIWFMREDSKYTIFRWIDTIVLFILLAIGGFWTAYHILYCFAGKLENVYLKKISYKISPKAIFMLSFLIISVLNCIILYTCRYPGALSGDSITQLYQVMTNTYSNHHPFYHTMLIKIFVTIGLKLFGDINAAVALYSTVQILFMAICFATVIYTLYEMNISARIIIAITAGYMLMPFHITYSFTMWKDVWFGGGITLFTVYTYRCLKKIGKNQLYNQVMLLVSGISVCLFRSNGLFVFVFTFLAFLFLFAKREKKIGVTFVAIIVVSFIMKHITLSALEVVQPDTIEFLSIPVQQISRVAVEYNDFTEEQRKLLEQVIDVEAISEAYLPYLSDPIKDLVRQKGNQQLIIDNKGAFVKLYIQVGLKHPITYIKAWVNQTRGFWNSGYYYWRWEDGVNPNPYGIERTVYSEWILAGFQGYLKIFSTNRFLQLFLCIGFYVWIDLFLCFISIIRGDKVGLFLTIPIIAIIASLVISTPVFAEFRYAYGVFCSLPFVAVTSFYKKEE